MLLAGLNLRTVLLPDRTGLMTCTFAAAAAVDDDAVSAPGGAGSPISLQGLSALSGPTEE